MAYTINPNTAATTALFVIITKLNFVVPPVLISVVLCFHFALQFFSQVFKEHLFLNFSNNSLSGSINLGT